jgi:hypothetical protein
MNLMGGLKVGWKTLVLFLCFALEFLFFVSFYSKLLLSHLLGTFVVSMSKFVYLEFHIGLYTLYGCQIEIICFFSLFECCMNV